MLKTRPNAIGIKLEKIWPTSTGIKSMFINVNTFTNKQSPILPYGTLPKESVSAVLVSVGNTFSANAVESAKSEKK